MANELAHASQGTELTQAEYESVTAHILNSQATGDIIYASSATQLSRLAIGSTNALLAVSGGIPAWTLTPTLTSLKLADGAEATPSLAFTDDTNSGFYRIGADNIGLALNGAKVVDITASLFTMLGDIGMNLGGFTGKFTHAITAARIWTLPNATGTVALLGLAQSWSAAQTFAAGLSLGSGQLSGNAQVFSNLGTVYIGDTANGSMTLGLTINQGSATDEIISLKSSAIAHGFTALTETDTYGYMKLVSGTDGGIQIGALRETATEVLQLLGVAGADVDTTKSTAGAAIITAYGSQGSGTGFANVVANGNVFALKGRSGGAWSALMIIDIDGDMWLGGTLNAVGAYQVAGVQVVGARVVDARCDDVVNSGDVTTDGVIDALRDAMITHGLIAAA